MKPIVHTAQNSYTPFGSVMQGRAYSSTAYRFGFNGKEKEADGTADNYDFGARIYDGRLGRWLAVDPSFRELCNVSVYKFSANSPIIYNDPTGKKEFLRIIFKDADGNITEIQQVEMSDEYYENKKCTSSLGGHDEECEYEYYDIYNVVEMTTDENGIISASGYTETSSHPVATRHPILRWVPIVRTAEDDEYSQPGGMRISTSARDGAIDPTKIESLGPADGLNIDVLVAALKKIKPDAVPKVLEKSIEIKEKLLKYKDKIKSDIEIKKETKKCFVHLCKNKSCVRHDPKKVQVDPNIKHTEIGTHESHKSDGTGGTVPVDCKEIEK
ncbi:MAG: RHS repeat-associated core domain-containing protein [Bacteroidia bacterium]|nr:RHS repeat-associated core domain-containing protein [Bacteroidia bacterium]